MATFRELFQQYKENNAHKFSSTFLENHISRVIGTTDSLLDIEYNRITDDMLDAALERRGTDFTKTTYAFVIHELDRLAGVQRDLKFDRQKDIWES